MNYYDTIAPGYNELYGKEQLDKWNFAKELMSFSEKDRVLDLGCGTGILTKLIAGEAGDVVGVDSSKEMLERAEKAENIEYVLASAVELPFEKDSFDKTVSFTVLQDIQDKQKALSEIKRVTKDEILLTILKRNKNLEELSEMLSDYFKIEKALEHEKDFVFVLRNE